MAMTDKWKKKDHAGSIAVYPFSTVFAFAFKTINYTC
jgi:hypothetical protein